MNNEIFHLMDESCLPQVHQAVEYIGPDHSVLNFKIAFTPVGEMNHHMGMSFG
jgi:hypothetical protein